MQLIIYKKSRKGNTYLLFYFFLATFSFLLSDALQCYCDLLVWTLSVQHLVHFSFSMFGIARLTCGTL